MAKTSFEAPSDIPSTNSKQSASNHKTQRSGPETTINCMPRENVRTFESAARDRKLIAPWPDPPEKLRNVPVSRKRCHAGQSEHRDTLSSNYRPNHDRNKQDSAQVQELDPVAPWKSVPKLPYKVTKVTGEDSALEISTFHKHAINQNPHLIQFIGDSSRIPHDQGGSNDFRCHTHSSLSTLPQQHEGCTSALIDIMPLVWPDEVRDTQNPAMHGFNNGQYLTVLRGPTPELNSSLEPKKKGILRRIFGKKTN